MCIYIYIYYRDINIDIDVDVDVDIGIDIDRLCIYIYIYIYMPEARRTRRRCNGAVVALVLGAVWWHSRSAPPRSPGPRARLHTKENSIVCIRLIIVVICSTDNHSFKITPTQTTLTPTILT